MRGGNCLHANIFTETQVDYRGVSVARDTSVVSRSMIKNFLLLRPKCMYPWYQGGVGCWNEAAAVGLLCVHDIVCTLNLVLDTDPF